MFQVGASRYNVEIPTDPIVFKGERCHGLCDPERLRILICPELPAKRRLAVLLHELAHAWFTAVGYPHDLEAACDLYATLAELAHRDLSAAGGEQALMRLRPGERFGRSTSRIMLSRSRKCRCDATIAPGDVHCQPDALRPGEVSMWFDCEHCGIRVLWNELATFGGEPSGAVVGEPRIEKAMAGV